MLSNQIKTYVLLAILTIILLAIGFFVGGFIGLTIALAIAVVINVLSYWYSDKIVLKMYKAKEASQEDYPELNEIVREVAMKAALPKPRVFVVPTSNTNAFATGRNEKKAVVAVTLGLLDLLEKDELSGVIAHEIAHIKDRDILISTVAAVIAGAIAYIALFLRFRAYGNSRGNGNVIALLLLAILAPLAALIIRSTISRSREYLADEVGAKIIRNPIALANALAKLNYSSKTDPMKLGNEATSHMFIVNPFSMESLINLFNTHPPITKRIGRLRSMTH